MASVKDNLKELFTNTRSRVIILFTALILIVGVTIGIIKLSSLHEGPKATAAVSAFRPDIQSIPGALNPTEEYAKLQETQNVTQASSAIKTGGSAIPTIIRTQELGAGVESVAAQEGKGGVGFATLASENEAGAQRSEWIKSLKNSSCSKSNVTQVLSEGASLNDLRDACSCIQLKDEGYKVTELQKICSCKELKSAGFNALQLKDIGFTADGLRACGFDACELRNAGFTAQQMKDGAFTDGELKGAGFSDNEIAKAAGLPNGVTEADVRKAGCQVEALQRLREAGVTAAAIRRISGCSAAQLKAAGFSAQDLRNAGFSAADLKNAGFTPDQLKKAGFSARDLLNAGFNSADLAAAGFTPAEIASAETELPPDVSPMDVKNAGCDGEALQKERLAGVSAKLIRRYAGCSAQALKAAGFTGDDLANAGFTPAQIAAAGPVSDADIRAAGCDLNKLRVLFTKGASAKQIRDLNGCSAQALKAAGYDAKALSNAGFTPQELLGAGFTPAQIAAAGPVSDADIRAAGCDPNKLRVLFTKGVSAKQIRDLNGCSAQALKAAGYDAKALSNAGFTPQELLDAGFSPQQLAQAGVGTIATIAAGRTADCSVASLQAARALGVSAVTIKQTLGCSAEAMKAAGYTAAELKGAGFTAGELKNAGFSAADLKNAGFSAKELRDAGFSAADLKNAGFSAKELRDAGFSAADLKNAGFSAKQLHDAGFSAADLKNAGFSPKDLRDAGFSAADLKNAGFSADDLHRAGYSAKELKEVGFTAAQLKNAGLTDAELQEAGFLPPGTQVAGLQNANQPGGIPSNLVATPSAPGAPLSASAAAVQANTQQLQAILKKQNAQVVDQQLQQKIQQRTAAMMSAANQSLQDWKSIATQTYTAGSQSEEEKKGRQAGVAQPGSPAAGESATPFALSTGNQKALIKTGDIVFAVLDTSVNSDEPSPILATIVSGRFKGAKLIGSFTLPQNAEKMVISFNTMSVPGAAKTTSITAYAIDQNTARTALATNVNHHYLYRYGSLFASSFLQGFGSAFQSANTTVTIGGSNGAAYTVQNGIGRSALENAVIGLTTVGQNWSQVAQQQFNTPITVSICAGTGMGILFTQDLTTL